MPYTDDQIRQAVIKLFKKYDKNHSGYIEGEEFTQCQNDLLKELTVKRNIPEEQAKKLLSSLDLNHDKKINRDELFIMMRKLNP